MKIIGLENLDKNFYENIIIDIDRIKVISKDNKDKTMNTSFSNSINGLSYEEIIIEVVEFFLRYNDITAINEDYYDKERRYILIKGTAGRRLMFSTQMDKELLVRIIEKYISNRRNFMLESINKKSELRGLVPECTSYHVNFDGVDVYNISTKLSHTFDFEREFFEELLEEKFNGCEVKLGSVKRTIKGTTYYLGDHITSEESDYVIKVSCYKDFKTELEAAIKSHNSRARADKVEKDYIRKMQLKMEGF